MTSWRPSCTERTLRARRSLHRESCSAFGTKLTCIASGLPLTALHDSDGRDRDCQGLELFKYAHLSDVQPERSLAKPEQTHADCHQAVAGAWRPWPTRRSVVRLYEVQRTLGLAGEVTGASLPASNQVELALGPEAVFRHTSPRSPLADAR